MTMRPLALLLLLALLSGCSNNFKVLDMGASPPGLGFPGFDGVFWRNGASGTWFSLPVIYDTNTSGIYSYSLYSANDKFNGDSVALAIQENCSCSSAQVRFYLPSPVDASAYHAAGHIQFDLELAQPYGSYINSDQISYGYSGSSGNTFSSVPIGTANSISFTHFSIALSAFPQDYTSQVDQVAFDFSGSAGIPGASILVLINDVKWTLD